MWGKTGTATFIENKIYLDVPFPEKDEAKALGARWDADAKRWYYRDENDAEKFTRWAMKPFMTYEDLSDEQQELIDRVKLGDNVLVDACIGSGKTTAIQVLCNELKGKRILYLTYNNLLKIDAQAKIRQAGVTVQNYHGFASKCLNNVGIKVDKSDLIQTFLSCKPPLGGRYELIVIDEYQDIEQEIAEMLEYIKEKLPDIQVVAVGDMKQKIYDKTTLDVPNFITGYLGDYTLLSFTKCFRLCEAHAARLGRIWGKEINGVNPNCKVETMKLGDAIKFLGEQNVSDVLCLGQRAGEMAEVLNLLERLYPDKYNKRTVYASIKDEDRSICRPSADNAIFTTFDSSKGLERKICLVFDFTSSYWVVRNLMPMTKYEIMRNIFLVAASRGKERIIFVESRKGAFLTDKELSVPIEMDDSERIKLKYARAFSMSEMFSFRYKEDVEECYKLLKIKKLNTEKNEIDIDRADCLIDLSPCVGIWQEASFFRKYDIDAQIDFEIESHPDRPRIDIKKFKTHEDKVLALTAITTGYQRYVSQVKLPVVNESQEKLIHDRLRTEFTGDEEVQRPCGLNFFAEDNKTVVMAEGRCDVVKDGIIWELKFTSELGHEEFLQLASYLVTTRTEKGILWNVRTNEKFEVSVPKTKLPKFMDAVVRCITKGDVQKYKPIFAALDVRKTKKNREDDEKKLEETRKAVRKRAKQKLKESTEAVLKKKSDNDVA